ncbi:MAG: OmpA family protein [Bacteroidetes bacterium]|nr:OmpA family protein [Bacteroidota bacterium]MDA0860277.1 OmpA family protein [Bacteroidota bacterium]MDA1318485.1 OmpA family protein [Bacteroidota bacterium]
MPKLIFIFMFSINYLIGQSNIQHVVYFETDKYIVPETEKNRILLFIKNLDVNKIKKISIYGFCDDRGSDNYNLILSQNRANAIKKVFSTGGIRENLISNVDGKGEILLKIVDSEDLNIIRGLNRKVEVNVEYNIPEKETSRLEDENEIIDNRKKPITLESNLLVGDKIVLDNILFRTGYSYVLKESIPVLEKIARILREKNKVYFTIQGHVCCTANGRDAIDRGTGRRNLSLARARYIYEYLMKNGVARKRMKYVGLKHKYPLGGDPKFDRRVEIEITNIID